MSDKVSALRTRLTDVVVLASGSAKMDLQSIVELLHAASEEGQESTAYPETLETLSSVPLVPDSDLYACQSIVPVVLKYHF